MVGKEGFRIGGGSGCTVDHEVSYSELPGGVIQNVYLIALRRRMLANFVYSTISTGKIISLTLRKRQWGTGFLTFHPWLR